MAASRIGWLQTQGVLLSHDVYDNDVLNDYYLEPTCWVSTGFGSNIAVQPHRADISYIITSLDPIEGMTVETKPYAFPLGEMRFQACIRERKSIGYNTSYEQPLRTRNPEFTLECPSGMHYAGIIKDTESKMDSIWHVDTCNGKYEFIKTPMQKIVHLSEFLNRSLIMDEKRQPFVTRYNHSKAQRELVPLCEATQVCYVDTIVRPWVEYFFTLDVRGTLTIYKNAKLSKAIRLLQVEDVIPSVKPVSTHNEKLFFVSRKGLEVCHLRTFEVQTLFYLWPEDYPTFLTLSYNETQLIYPNKNGMNVLELGNDRLYSLGLPSIMTSCQFPRGIAYLICEYSMKDFRREFVYTVQYPPACQDVREILAHPDEALSSSKLIKDLRDQPGCFLHLEFKNLLLDLLKQADQASDLLKTELHENIDALLLLLFLYEKFPIRPLVDNINHLLIEFPKILNSELSGRTKELLDKLMGLEKDPSVRKRYIGIFEHKTSESISRAAIACGLKAAV